MKTHRDEKDDKRDRDRRDDDDRRPPKPADKDADEARRKRREQLRRDWARLRQDRKRTYTPWLVIRSAPWDLGLRPLPAGTAFWLSPDISVESSDPLGRAVAGEDNFLHARVFNLGMAVSVPTSVDFYWADPSVGLGAEHMNLIGTEWVEIPPHSALDVRCNAAWVPGFLNGGHECLKVNCNNQARDPIQHPFDPPADRHAGQRNITVIEGAPGETLKFRLSVNNVLRAAALIELVARIDHLLVRDRQGEKLRGPELIAALASFGQPQAETADALVARIGKDNPDHHAALAAARLLGGAARPKPTGIERLGPRDRSATTIRAAWTGPGTRTFPSDRDRDLTRASAPRHERVSTRAGGIVLLRDTFEGFERRGLDLEIGVPANARPGEFLAAHLEQQTGEVLTGGYTLVVAVRG